MIGMVIFQPGASRQVYGKQYLHADELPFFTAGDRQVFLDGKRIALSICYELSVPEHAAYAAAGGASIYLSSVAKTAAGMAKALETLAATASGYSLTVLLANCVGHCDDFDCGGQTAVLNNKGEVLAVLNAVDAGMLVYDTGTGVVDLVGEV
jgi:predicted amidohydrolase